MASLISHAVAALGVGAAFYRPKLRKRAWVLGVACSILPDADVIGFRFGIPTETSGATAASHTLCFSPRFLPRPCDPDCVSKSCVRRRKAALVLFFLGNCQQWLARRHDGWRPGRRFFSPFDTARYFLPWRPILVSPIGVARFLSPRGLAVLRGEIFWIWLPAVFLAFCACLFRRFRTPQRNE